MSGVQYSGSYGENLFDTRSTYSPLVDNDMAVSLAVAHTAMQYSGEHHNDRTNNGITCE